MREPSAKDAKKERYQGKKLAYLVLALCLPAALLYLRLVLGLAATDNRTPPGKAALLARLSLAALAVFFLVQAGCALYVQKTFAPGQTTSGTLLRYVGMFIFCMLFSLTGAITLEAFGLNLFLRAH